MAAGYLRKDDRVGRYVVLSRLGEGGMGVVYAALDPELNRKVALKLLQPSRELLRTASQGQARLLREAQAMARLSHPNVAAVYDVGTLGDRVFLAMELVDGASFRQWRKASLRPWRELVAVMVDAGRGLAAAHAAGLVHRDVKPDNILISASGQAKVTDFGLARDTAEAAPPVAPAALPTADKLSSTLTEAGAIVGTPSYMAPEQLDGRAADALTDQFSFCVTLYEALYGYRPFGPEERQSMKRGEAVAARPPPRQSEVPAWVRAAVLQGLALNPAQRFGDMTALLRALTHDPWVARRRAALVGLGFLAALGLAVGYHRISQRRALCQGSEEHLAGIWDTATREAVHAAFTRTGKSFAEDSWKSTARALDRYAGAWTAMRTGACEATRFKGEQSEAVLQLRMACLDRRAQELGALTRLFATGDAALVRRAPQAAAGLTELDACADVEGLTAPVPPPKDPKVRAAVAPLQQKLAAVSALYEAGRYGDGLVQVAGPVSEARQTDYAPLLADALLLQGRLQSGGGRDPKGAAQSFFDAKVAAEAGKADRVRAEASLELIEQLAQEARWADANHEVQLARALARRLGGDDRLTARVDIAEATVLMSQVDVKSTLPLYERALAVAARHPEDWRLNSQILTLSSHALERVGEHQRARDLAQDALEIRERELGPWHPDVADALGELGGAERDLNHADRARELYTRRLQIDQRALGEDAVDTANAHYAVGISLYDAADYGAALEEFRKSLATYEKLFGKDNPRLSAPISVVGNCLDNLGRVAEALAAYQQAIALVMAAGKSTSQNLYFFRASAADALWDLGKPAEAALEMRRALDVAETQGKDWPDATDGMARMGRILAELGRLDEALAWAERAVGIVERRPSLEAFHVVHAYTARSEVFSARHQTAAALKDAERAVTLVAEKGLAPHQPYAIQAVVQLGKAALDLGDAARGLHELERGLEISRDKRASPIDLATNEKELAFALRRTGKDPARARALATDAKERFVGFGNRSAAGRIDRWLAGDQGE